jgi:hypothetical protein
MVRVVAALLLLTTAAQAQTPPPAPTCDAPQYRAFDFWIGEWDAYVTGTENLAGRSTIASEDGGCVVTEYWRSQDGSGYTGRSINIYDRQTGHWEQHWVDSTGEATHFVGGPIEGGAMRITDPANQRTGINNGQPFQVRMTFTPNPDGSVRQHGETSGDGATWTSRYDYTYRRHAE